MMQNFQPIFKQDKETARNAMRSFGKQLKSYKEMGIPTYLYDHEKLKTEYYMLTSLERLIPVEKPYFSDYF